MEIDLYRDDGIVHVITTGANYVDGILWVSSYFGASRYDGRRWRGYYDTDSGTPSNFYNNLRGRSAHEAWFASDKGVGAIVDADTNTWVAYTMDPKTHKGKAAVYRDRQVIHEVVSDAGIAHNYILAIDFDGDDVWVATAKGLSHGRGEGYYPRLRPKE